MSTLKDMIMDVVKRSQGIKIMELIASPGIVEKALEDDEDLIDVIDKMVLNDDIIEIQYVLPDMDHRIKSFLLPAGTEFLASWQNILEAVDSLRPVEEGHVMSVVGYDGIQNIWMKCCESCQEKGVSNEIRSSKIIFKTTK